MSCRLVPAAPAPISGTQVARRERASMSTSAPRRLLFRGGTHVAPESRRQSRRSRAVPGDGDGRLFTRPRRDQILCHGIPVAGAGRPSELCLLACKSRESGPSREPRPHAHEGCRTQSRHLPETPTQVALTLHRDRNTSAPAIGYCSGHPRSSRSASPRACVVDNRHSPGPRSPSGSPPSLVPAGAVEDVRLLVMEPTTNALARWRADPRRQLSWSRRRSTRRRPPRCHRPRPATVTSTCASLGTRGGGYGLFLVEEQLAQALGRRSPRRHHRAGARARARARSARDRGTASPPWLRPGPGDAVRKAVGRARAGTGSPGRTIGMHVAGPIGALRASRYRPLSTLLHDM